MVDQKHIEYIKNSLSQGKSKEDIYKDLLGQGWGINDIQDAFNQVTTKEEGEDIQRRVIRIILTIGVILIGAGIFSFIAANWQEITKITKVAIIVIAMVASYGIGWFLKERLQYIKTGEAFFLLGSIIYGAGIFLIAQMFHIRVNWPDGFILWMIGTIAMAFAVESFPLFYLSIPLGIIAIMGSPAGIFGVFPLYDQFLLTSSLLFLIATIVTFVSGWLVRKRMPPELRELY